MEYTRPSISTLGGEIEPQSTWVWVESVVAGVFAFVVTVVVSQIDVTP